MTSFTVVTSTQTTRAPADLAEMPSSMLLTKSEAARRLSISRTTLDRLIARGSIKTVPVMTQARISVAELRRFCDLAA